MHEIDKALLLLSGLTGLTLEDLLHEAEAPTEEERQTVMAENVAKMADFMKGSPGG